METSENSMQDKLLQFISDPAFRDDPYPFYREILRKEPIIQGPDGTWWILSYEGCISLVRDKRWSHQNPASPGSGEMTGIGLARRMVGQMVLFRDPPDHTRLRGLLGRIFILPEAERKREEFREHIIEVLDGVSQAGVIDFKEKIARLIPIYMICDVVGLPQTRYDDLVRWSNSYASMLSVDITPEMEAAADADFAEFFDYLAPIVDDRRRNPKSDLISEWVRALDRGELSVDEVPSYVLFTLTGGQATTTTTMTNGLYTLLSHKSQWERFRTDPHGLKKTLADEILRYESAGRALVPRWAMEDIEIGGKVVRKGEMAIGIESAANRDPTVFENPDVFDIGRNPNKHLAFGGGLHMCPGQFVARVEIQELFAAIAERYPNIEMGQRGDWIPDWILRGLTELPVNLGKRATQSELVA